MNITFDKYTGKYFISFTDSNVVSMTFAELEEFKETIHNVVQDVYNQQLQDDLLGDYSCDGCTI